MVMLTAGCDPVFVQGADKGWPPKRQLQQGKDGDKEDGRGSALFFVVADAHTFFPDREADRPPLV
jgi:hypothetical protein